MPQVNTDNQKKVIFLINEIVEKVRTLDRVCVGLSSQDRMLIGAVCIGMYNPWTDSETIHFVGNNIMVPVVINKMVDTFRKGPDPLVKNKPSNKTIS